MWDAQIDTMDGGRVSQVKILCDGKPVSYAEIVKRWQSDGIFREFFIGILADAPYAAYLWETPPIARLTLTQDFEFVLVDSPSVARARYGTWQTDKLWFSEWRRLPARDGEARRQGVHLWAARSSGGSGIFQVGLR